MLKTVQETDRLTVIEIQAGVLDASNSQQFREAVTPMLHSNTIVLLDLSGVEFVDSSGLGALLSCLRRLNEVQGDLQLCSLAPPVRYVLQLARVHKIIDIFNDRDEALRAARS